jgi:hypothetical protein
MNIGKASLTLPLVGRTPTADFQVSDQGGRLIWSRLRGQTVLGALRLFPLEAGKRLTFHAVWNQRTDSGSPVASAEYLIRGVLLTDAPGGLPSPPAHILINA